jgi:hypothetical protein
MRKPGIAVIMLAASCGGPLGSGSDANGSGPGSGPGSGQLDIYQSGSRIKMNVLSTPDGAKVFMGSRDTMLNIDCSFVPAADGVTRCLPAFSNPIAFTPNPYFGDSACTIPVAQMTGCTTPTHVLQYPAPACPSGGYRVFSVGAKYATAFVKSGTTCTAFTSSPSVTYYALGSEISPATFQSAALDVE